MSHASVHLYAYRQKVVRDLAWAFSSPHIISDDVDDHDVDIFSDVDARQALRDSHEWLRRLDDDPSHLLRWVATQRGANKLGFYFGALIEYAARFCPAVGAEAVTVHRQVASGFGAGKMVGQLKLVIKRKRRRRRERRRRIHGGCGGGGERGEGNVVFDAVNDDDFIDVDDGSFDEERDDDGRVATEEIIHWEYNVKYFVDGGSCCPPSRRKLAAAAAASAKTYVAAAAAADAADAAAVSSGMERKAEPRDETKAEEDDDDDDASIIALAPPPTGDSCYVGPFLHENLHIRVQEARRKLALAAHPRVADWLERWARCQLSEDTRDGEGNVYEKTMSTTTRSLSHVSQQILRGYLFYPLDGDERGLVGWDNVPVRGSASPGHLRGWWVDRPEDLVKVPGSHPRTGQAEVDGAERDGGGMNGGVKPVDGDGVRENGCDDDDGSDGDGLMWAILTRKCHWLGPCEAVRSSGESDRDGADTEWVVRGVPELGIRDVEVVPTSRVADATQAVIDASGRGVLLAEMRRDVGVGGVSGGGVVWRERSRGFVLPKAWDPWTTVMRQDPFRRRYERGAAVTATEDTAADELEPEGVFEVTYPTRADVTDLGDDVRVRDKASLDASRIAAREAEDRGGGPRRRGEAGVTRADAGDRLLAAAIGGEDGDGGPGGAVALLKAVRDVIREEGSVARPVRPHLVKALGAVGSASAKRGDDAGNVAVVGVVVGGGGASNSSAGQTVSLGDDGDRRVSSLKQLQAGTKQPSSSRHTPQFKPPPPSLVCFILAHHQCPHVLW